MISSDVEGGLYCKKNVFNKLKKKTKKNEKKTIQKKKLQKRTTKKNIKTCLFV